MKTEAQVNAIIDEGLDRYYEENRRMQNGAISDVDSVRKEVIDILTQYAGEDGVISRERVQQVLRELDVSESTYENVLNEVVEEVVDRTIERAINLSIAALGVYLTVDMIPRSISENIKELVLSRPISDGLSMADRFYRLAGNIHDGIRSIVRDGIIRGSTIVAISREISRFLGRNEYHIRNIIMTEGFNIYRRTLVETAKISGVVRAVKIVDNRGRHRYHERHRCYILAERDTYGWGKGVYRLDDAYIYYPHPQCTAYYRFLLIPEDERRKIVEDRRRGE